ncbi:MAG: IS3 family transposase, partial [Chloroflexi bacterium]|nr:IS3 family transposase [Chloroflexota bacterium]
IEAAHEESNGTYGSPRIYAEVKDKVACSENRVARLMKKLGLVTPHAAALALITPSASAAITNLQTISNTYPLAYNDMYGFMDSVMTKPGDPDYGKSSYRFTALAQEWIFLSLTNYQSGFIWDYLYRDNGVFQAHAEMYGSVVYLPLILK